MICILGSPESIKLIVILSNHFRLLASEQQGGNHYGRWFSFGAHTQ